MPATVVLSDHAIARYVERVKPGLDQQAALEELCAILPQGDLLEERPDWVDVGEAKAWLAIGDCMVFPLRGDRSALVATTCLVRGGASEDRRAAKKARKKQQRERRAVQRQLRSGRGIKHLQGREAA